MFDRNEIKIRAIKIQQPIGEFFVGVISARDIVEISYADVRRMERDLDEYMGIQRRLSSARVKELRKYVNRSDATFPTAVILAVPEDNAVWDDATGTLTLQATEETSFENIAKIIDGQHRVDGLKEFNGGSFDVNVSIFVGADVPTQANIFATVNLAQTKVNKSLVYDLFDYEKQRSPQKSAHHIAVALDQYEESPLRGRIKRLGTATPGRKNEMLTQAAVVESLVDYMSQEPSEDRETYIKRLFPRRADGQLLKRYIFRNLFIDNKDDKIAKIVLEYFKAVQKKWPKAWHDFETRGNVLPKTNGFKALMRFLRPAYLAVVGEERIGETVRAKDFDEIFERINVSDEDFNVQNFPPGTSGESTLYSWLMSDAFPDVGGQGRLGL